MKYEFTVTPLLDLETSLTSLAFFAGLEVACLELPRRLSDAEILRTQFLCHRAKFAAPLLGSLCNQATVGQIQR